jgi:hypothetical protein
VRLPAPKSHAKEVIEDRPVGEQGEGAPEHHVGVAGELEQLDARALAHEDADEAGGDAEVPEDHGGHERGGRAHRRAAHAREHPHDETHRGRADPAVKQRVDPGGIDAAEGEGRAVLGEPVEQVEDRHLVGRMPQRRGVNGEDGAGDHPVHRREQAGHDRHAHRRVDRGELGIAGGEVAMER